jgi:hypothetical protein
MGPTTAMSAGFHHAGHRPQPPGRLPHQAEVDETPCGGVHDRRIGVKK